MFIDIKTVDWVSKPLISMPQTMDVGFRRIQFTPDILPGDIIGTKFVIFTSPVVYVSFHSAPDFCLC